MSVAFGIRKPRAVINVLQLAIRVLSPNPHCLTSAHALLLQVNIPIPVFLCDAGWCKVIHFSHTPGCSFQACIKGQVYDVAVDFLRTHDILEIDMKNAAVSGSDFLKYFYYAGIW